MLARIGTSDPVVPTADMARIIDGFDITRFGRATAKFDPADLAQVNAKVVQELTFSAVAERLDAVAVGGGEPRGGVPRGGEPQEVVGCT